MLSIEALEVNIKLNYVPRETSLTSEIKNRYSTILNLMNFSTQNVYIKVQDYSVSNENFELLQDPELELLKTHPQPDLVNLGKYYESEDYISHTDSKRSLFEKMYHW